MFEKVNTLTFKLKTHLGKVGGQTSVVGEEEGRGGGGGGGGGEGQLRWEGQQPLLTRRILSFN